MIETITLNDFKAHTDLIINLNHANKLKKNCLLYGENGTGKSSFYEALKLYFFKSRLIKESNIDSIGRIRTQDIKEYFLDFNNNKTNKDFEIVINEKSVKGNEEDNNTFSSYKLFMINSKSTLLDSGSLNFFTLLEREYLNLNIKDIDIKRVEEYTNKNLKEFKEEVQVIIEKNGDVKIVDERRNIDDKRLEKFYNEGKVNLVVILLLLTTIRLYSHKDETNILVLDDFITSLDMANRTYLIKYIFEAFKEFQIFIFTHNIYFFNLINYTIDSVKYDKSSKWEIFNLYETSEKTKIYSKSDRISLGKNDREENSIRYRFKQLEQNQNSADDYSSLGNDIRKKFERTLYEFSKLLSIGGVEESNKVLENIEKKNFMIRDPYKILNKLDKDDPTLLNNYKVKDFELIQDTLRNLTLYRKVAMHPLSHATEYGEINYSKKEIKSSIELLAKLENSIKDLTNKKI